MDYDVLVIGGGIAGIESALTLGDMGFSVLLVEKEVSIGGKMVLLSKVFPTLDCASCISTPKMAAVANHPNVTVVTFSEIRNIMKREDGIFAVTLYRKPTYVDAAKCTGCSQCEKVCTVAMPDGYNNNLIARRAISIAFPQAVPKKAVIDRKGTSPCSSTCPAGVKAHGYISLVRAGKYDEAFHLHMEDAPLPGSLSRVCYAPCEDECTRGSLEGAVPIRGIKRFIVDRYYAGHPEPEYGPPEETNGKKVAVVGSGPAGLSAAYFLAREGYPVTVFESGPETGGVMRSAIPPSRLPRHIIDRDIKNITALGVEIKTDTRIRSVQSLKEQGFSAVFLAVGIAASRKPSIPGEGTEQATDVDASDLTNGSLLTTAPFAAELGLNENGTVPVNEETLETPLPSVFAGGDAISGPSTVALAVGHGKRAAFYINRYLQDQPLETGHFDEKLPMVDRELLVSQVKGNISYRKPVEIKKKPAGKRAKPAEEAEMTMSEDEARYSANRCLDCGGCSQCQQCISVCPAGAISFDMKGEERVLDIGSVVIATGFEVFDANRKPALGYGRFPNVIDAMQMDRILAPVRPYNAVIRPSDGKAPGNIAIVLCTGSRDHKVNNLLCSRVCCMYSLKQAQLLMGSLPLADITVYYIDIRAFGKGYDEFYEQARAMGVYFTRGKVARIEEMDNQDLKVHYEDIEGDGGMKQAEHDLVVLSTGMLPTQDALNMFENGQLEADIYSYIREIDENLEPCKTSIEGVFVAGAASASRDIPDSILHSGAAAAQTAAYLKKGGHRS